MMQESALALRDSIAHLAFPLTPASTQGRRFSRHVSKVEVKEEVKEETPLSPLQGSSKKRKNLLDEKIVESPGKKRRFIKRGYASPETYAHLSALDDYLASGLDVMFCGINPGEKSALTGHHFANPTNHFWKCLHHSGFTPRLLPAAEDSTLPSLYNIGLTNLVERPSIEQAELSKEEMEQSVPTLKAKIVTYRPHIVCFVGKGIWLIVEAAFKKQIAHTPSTSTSERDAHTISITPPSTPKRSLAKRKAPASFDWGLQPYKFVYPSAEESKIKSEDGSTPGSGESIRGTAVVSETLFFVTPSTSGRVVSHQLNDKVELFARLRGDLEEAKSKTLDTTGMMAVPLM